MGSSFGVSLYALCIYIIQLIFKVRSVLTMSLKVTPLLNPRETYQDGSTRVAASVRGVDVPNVTFLL